MPQITKNQHHKEVIILANQESEKGLPLIFGSPPKPLNRKRLLFLRCVKKDYFRGVNSGNSLNFFHQPSLYSARVFNGL